MISDYKDLCYQSAQIIEGWENIDKNELCRLYVKETDKDRANGYLSAILYDFWSITESNYNRQRYKIATEGDCIDWTVTGILYALKHHIWDDPNNALYNDPKGPEKAINVCIYSTKINFYQRIKHHKEKVNYETLSLEQLLEDSSDGYYTPTTDDDFTVENYLSEMIKDAFLKKDYFKAFALDTILNNNVFELVDGYTVFSEKKLRKILRWIDDKYCILFSEKYNVDIETVRKSIHYVTDLSAEKLKERVETLFRELQHDRNLVAYLVR